MPDDLKPVPSGDVRKTIARRVRQEALTLSNDRASVVAHQNNSAATMALLQPGPMIAAHGTFTKGLAHDPWGRVHDEDLRGFISAIDQDANGESYAETPFPGVYSGPDMGRPAKFDAALYTGGFSRPSNMQVRAWESPISGHTFDLEGADAGQVSMPPAPPIGSSELTAEMAEVYGAALVRDLPFEVWDGITQDSEIKLLEGNETVALQVAMRDMLKSLNGLDYFTTIPNHDACSEKRRKARFRDGTILDGANIFRGSTPGAHIGPYISQFLYLGSEALRSAEVSPETQAAEGSDTVTTVTEGLIRYGIQTIQQAFLPHRPGVDHMVEWQTWLDVQNGADRRGALDVFLQENGTDTARFIATPRDLATYVHYDALYQAYLNACLLLLGAGAATDIGLPEGEGNATRAGFATFGGPHILTLVCEVATRALKAVRRQKYNVHLRSRPEALAAAVSMAWTGDETVLTTLGNQRTPLVQMAAEMSTADNLLGQVAKHNKTALAFWEDLGWPVDHGPLGSGDRNALLPMAFPEGSPMHPAYGAGHATVAGACVTVLKAFFEMFETDRARTFSIYDALGIGSDKNLYDNTYPADLFGAELPLTITQTEASDLSAEQRARIPFATAVLPDPNAGYKQLKPVDIHLKIEDELDKLAANISIGRNFAGVHYYTDYYESLRMGERIAVSILQEQMLTYREPVSMRFTSFDGDKVMIVGTGGTRDQDDTAVLVWTEDGQGGTHADFDAWWSRHIS